MPENRRPVRIHLNVMRSRLTVIGFNIAIVSFQIAQLYKSSSGLRLPGLDHAVHVGADMELFLSLALSLIALMVFIMSNSFNESPICTHWTLVAGDLLMYLALAHTLAGFFAPLASTIKIVAGNLPDKASQVRILKAAAIGAGGVAWFLAVYVGPLVSLVRSPFQHRINITLGSVYLVVLLVLCWVSAQTVQVEAAVPEEPGLVFSVLRELVQPLRW